MVRDSRASRGNGLIRILCYTYAILCYTMLCYTILYYNMYTRCRGARGDASICHSSRFVCIILWCYTTQASVGGGLVRAALNMIDFLKLVDSHKSLSLYTCVCVCIYTYIYIYICIHIHVLCYIMLYHIVSYYSILHYIVLHYRLSHNTNYMYMLSVRTRIRASTSISGCWRRPLIKYIYTINRSMNGQCVFIFTDFSFYQ